MHQKKHPRSEKQRSADRAGGGNDIPPFMAKTTTTRFWVTAFMVVLLWLALTTILLAGDVIQHTVKPNESLSRIARQYNVTVTQILSENSIPNPDVIRAGTVLTITLPDATETPVPTSAPSSTPAADQPPTPPPAPTPTPTSTGAPTSDANKAGGEKGSEQNGSAQNGSEETTSEETSSGESGTGDGAGNDETGDSANEDTAPTAGGTATPSPAKASTPRPSAPPCDRTSRAGDLAYTVRSGDSLYSLANRYGTSISAIKSRNCLTSNLLLVGQRVVIPRVNPPPTTELPPTRTPRPTATRTPTPRPTSTPTPNPTPTPTESSWWHWFIGGDDE